MYSLDGFSVDLVKSVHGHSRFYHVKAFGKAVDSLANIGEWGGGTVVCLKRRNLRLDLPSWIVDVTTHI